MRASSPTEKERNRQISRTGSPQKKQSIATSSKRETIEAGLQSSNTPILKDSVKTLGLKNKLQDTMSQPFSMDNLNRANNNSISQQKEVD